MQWTAGEEVATFDAALTDMEKAISALERAIETLKASKPSLAQIKSLVRTSLLMADAMDMAPKSRKVVTMLLSEDQPITDVPTSDYDFHSGGIIETSEDIATSQADLTETTAMLNDDRVYLKDMTEKCETKAKLWDQRSQMRADELSALTQALSVLETAVAEKAEASGEGGRSLQQKENKTETKQVEAKKVEPVSFVQEQLVRKMVPDDDVAKRERLVSLLTSAGKKLHSTVLS